MEAVDEVHSPSTGSSALVRDDSLLVRMLLQLQEELRAYLFLFVEVSCVSSTAATSRSLRDFLWNDPAFWKVYGGVACFGSTVHGTSANKLREQFRIWLFHLEDDWATEFQEAIMEERQSDFGANFLQFFKDARYIASGLMPWDSTPQVTIFSELSSALLKEYNPKQLDERWAAESFISKVERREDVFSKEQVQQITDAFEESLEKSILQQHFEGVEEMHLAEPLPEAADWQSWELEDESAEESLGDEFSEWPARPGALLEANYGDESD